jgi:hypothetical protein
MNAQLVARKAYQDAIRLAKGNKEMIAKIQAWYREALEKA